MQSPRKSLLRKPGLAEALHISSRRAVRVAHDLSSPLHQCSLARGKPVRISPLKYLCRGPGVGLLCQLRAPRQGAIRIADTARRRAYQHGAFPVGECRVCRELLAELRESLLQVGTPSPKLSVIGHVTIFGSVSLVQGR